jgi:hypothetical protein
MLFAYFSPEVTLPVATALAGAFGFLLMIGKAPFRWAGRGIRALIRAFKGTETQTPPATPPPPAE